MQGSHVRARRNPHYWNDAATRLDGVKYLQIADENAELARYRAGELQVTFVVPRGQFDWIKANLAGQLHVAPQLTTYYYGFNLERAPFKDQPQLRRALSLVIDREKLARAGAARGRAAGLRLGAAGHRQLHARSPSTTRDTPMPERIREAQRLYAAAGYSPEKPLRFELRYNTGEVHTKLARGHRLHVEGGAGRGGAADAGGVQVAAAGHRSRRRRDVPLQLGRRLQRRLHLRAVPEERLRHEPAALRQRRSTTRCSRRPPRRSIPAKRRALLEQAERLMLADHPLLPLYFYVNKHLVKPEVRGLVRQRHERRLQQGPRAQARRLRPPRALHG